jgi:hypothetical protein
LSNHVVEPDFVMHTAHEQLAVDEDGNVHIQNEWSEEAIRILLKSLEDSMATGLGQTTGHCSERFSETLYKPRRGALEYPLKLRQLSK